jgi:hypothetical protein
MRLAIVPDSPHEAIRAPFWITALLLFLAVWLGVEIVRGVTETLTAVATSPSEVLAMLAEPTR